MTHMEHLINLINSTGHFGYVILFLIIFLESFPIAFFLPGESLLFTVGFLASQGYFDPTILIVLLFIASVLGYILSYQIGEKIREFILKSNDKYWFKKKHIEKTQEFYKKYGAKTVIIGRFIPIVRSFSSTLAGTVDMNYRKFLKYTVVGGFIWVGGFISAGFHLGKLIPNSERLLTPIVLVIICFSVVPIIVEYLMEKKRNKASENKTPENI